MPPFCSFQRTCQILTPSVKEVKTNPMARPLDKLCDIYKNFNKNQGLNLGSADEHVFDQNLTQEQRDWLLRFIRVWDQAVVRPWQR